MDIGDVRRKLKERLKEKGWIETTVEEFFDIESLNLKTKFISTHLDAEGESFTKECILDAMGNLLEKELPVWYDFNPSLEIGTGTNLTFDGEYGWVDLTIKKESEKIIQTDFPLYVVPSFYILNREGGQYLKIRFIGFGVTRNPSDESLSPLLTTMMTKGVINK